MSDNFVNETHKFLDENKRLPAIYGFKWHDLDFIGLNSVFSPMIFQDSFFFADELVCISSSRFLEIGCGTGLIAVALARNGVKVTACDISEDALKNTRLNCILHNVDGSVDVLKSDVFSQIENLGVFDIVFWNLPFQFSSFPCKTELESACFSFEYRNIGRYFEGAREVLAVGGRVLFGFSVDSGDCTRLDLELSRYSLDAKIISHRTLSTMDEPMFRVGLFELHKEIRC